MLMGELQTNKHLISQVLMGKTAHPNDNRLLEKGRVAKLLSRIPKPIHEE
jgi:hypothetical protein